MYNIYITYYIYIYLHKKIYYSKMPPTCKLIYLQWEISEALELIGAPIFSSASPSGFGSRTHDPAGCTQHTC